MTLTIDIEEFPSEHDPDEYWMTLDVVIGDTILVISGATEFPIEEWEIEGVYINHGIVGSIDIDNFDRTVGEIKGLEQDLLEASVVSWKWESGTMEMMEDS